MPFDKIHMKWFLLLIPRIAISAPKGIDQSLPQTIAEQLFTQGFYLSKSGKVIDLNKSGVDSVTNKSTLVVFLLFKEEQRNT